MASFLLELSEYMDTKLDAIPKDDRICALLTVAMAMMGERPGNPHAERKVVSKTLWLNACGDVYDSISEHFFDPRTAAN